MADGVSYGHGLDLCTGYAAGLGKTMHQRCFGCWVYTPGLSAFSCSVRGREGKSVLTNESPIITKLPCTVVIHLKSRRNPSRGTDVALTWCAGGEDEDRREDAAATAAAL